MVVFYHKQTGEIIASFPEVYDLAPEITVERENEGPELFGRHVLGPEEARPFEDPRDPRNVHHYRVEIKRGKPTGRLTKSR